MSTNSESRSSEFPLARTLTVEQEHSCMRKYDFAWSKDCRHVSRRVFSVGKDRMIIAQYSHHHCLQYLHEYAPLCITAVFTESHWLVTLRFPTLRFTSFQGNGRFIPCENLEHDEDAGNISMTLQSPSYAVHANPHKTKSQRKERERTSRNKSALLEALDRNIAHLRRYLRLRGVG